VFFTTSNGTRALLAARAAAAIGVAALVNVTAAAAWAAGAGRDVAILCAGSHGAWALEDWACGGLAVERILAAVPTAVLTEAARIRLGWPRHGHEIRDEFNAFEIGLARDVHLDKGCFTGQEALLPVPKLNVPAWISSCVGRTTGVAVALSTNVQFPLISVIARVLVIVLGSTLARRLVRIPRPASVRIELFAALVSPPPIFNKPVPLPPLIARLAL